MTINDNLINQIRKTHKISIQNKLMGIKDREIALSMIYMKNFDRNYLFSMLSPVKSKRIHEELKMYNR